MYSFSIFLALLLAATPASCTTYNPSAEGNPVTPEMCEDIRTEMEDAVANAGLDPAIASQVISNCLANL